MRMLEECAEISDFQRRVYEATMEIPRGRVTTYKWLGLSIGCHSPRAIGQALRRCPFDSVPCHRVIAAGPRVGGFAGTDDGPDITHKTALLEAEGLQFQNGLLQDKSRLFMFGLE